MGNQSCSTSAPGVASHSSDPDRLAIELELNLGIRQQTGLFANGERDGDLAL